MKAFINGRVLIDGRFQDDLVVSCDCKIRQIGGDVDDSSQLIDLKGHYLLPGLIDIHIHGAGGGDVMDASLNAYQKISATLARSGVTRFLATTMTMPWPAIARALTTARQVVAGAALSGAKPLGVHLEGPFISRQFTGAQDGAHILPPDWSKVEPYRDVIKLITLAVEEDVDWQFIKRSRGIVLSVGHSAATFEQALASYQLGVRHCTHCFNAMSGLHHRRPGVVGAVFSRRYDTEVIADGVHIHRDFLSALIRIIGPDNAILISDGMRATGMPLGQYELGGQSVIVDDEAARLANGQLAGSTLTLDRAIRNMVEYTDCDLAEIVNMATRNPARSIGCDADYGAIKLAAAADFVEMDTDFNVISTWIDGECVYRQSSDYRSEE